MLENENNIQNDNETSLEEASAGIADAAETEEVSQERIEAVHSAQGTPFIQKKV